MLKITHAPRELKASFNEFRDEFTKPSHESLAQIIGAMINSEGKRTISNLQKSISGGKSRTAFEYFFNEGKWDEDSVAQRKADYFFREARVGPGDRVLLVIDDVYEEKEGDKTEGVGKFYDHSKGRYIHGNNFVTSALQVGSAYVPHKAKMYLKKESAEAMGEEFRKKPEIAYKEIIEPLEIPESSDLYVVFDSWWYSAEFVGKTKDLGHEVVCRLKSNKKIVVDDEEMKLEEFEETLDYEEVSIVVRGKEKKYLARSLLVEIPDLGKVKLVISKGGGGEDPHYIMSTDLDLSTKEILEIYENRWSIEIAHREANQKFGFRDYQMRGKRAIERFMQLSFLTWFIILISHTAGKDFRTIIKEMKLGDILDETKFLYFLKSIIVALEIFLSADSMEELAEQLWDLFRS